MKEDGDWNRIRLGGFPQLASCTTYLLLTGVWWVCVLCVVTKLRWGFGHILVFRLADDAVLLLAVGRIEVFGKRPAA